MDLDALYLELVRVVLVLAVERGVGVYPVDGFNVLSDKGKNFFLSLGWIFFLKIFLTNCTRNEKSRKRNN